MVQALLDSDNRPQLCNTTATIIIPPIVKYHSATSTDGQAKSDLNGAIDNPVAEIQHVRITTNKIIITTTMEESLLSSTPEIAAKLDDAKLLCKDESTKETQPAPVLWLGRLPGSRTATTIETSNTYTIHDYNCHRLSNQTRSRHRQQQPYCGDTTDRRQQLSSSHRLQTNI